MAAASEEFPPVEGGGSLILAWQIRNKKVLIIGGGEVSNTPSANPLSIDIDVDQSLCSHR